VLSELALDEAMVEFGLGMEGLGRAAARSEEVAVDMETGSLFACRSSTMSWGGAGGWAFLLPNGVFFFCLASGFGLWVRGGQGG